MPGLLPPRPAADEVKASDPAEAAPPEEDADATAADAAKTNPEAVAAPDAEAEAGADVAADAEEEEDEDRGEPLFEVSDRRATILADRVGIVFRLDGEEADFTWDEIGAVEIDTPRFSKRFAVTVYTGPRRWFEAHVEAKSRGLLKTWTAELDAVLDEHFEDPDDRAEDTKADVQAADAPEPDAVTEATEAAEAEEAADDTEAEEKAEDKAEAEDKADAKTDADA